MSGVTSGGRPSSCPENGCSRRSREARTRSLSLPSCGSWFQRWDFTWPWRTSTTAGGPTARRTRASRRLLARAAESLAEEDHLLEEQAGRLDSSLLEDRQAFQAIPVALQRRLLHRLRPELAFAEVEALRLRPGAAAAQPTEASPSG